MYSPPTSALEAADCECLLPKKAEQQTCYNSVKLPLLSKTETASVQDPDKEVGACGQGLT